VQKLLERRAIEHDEPDERALCFALCRSAARRGADKHAPEGEELRSEAEKSESSTGEREGASLSQANAAPDHDGEPGWKRKARVRGFDLEATTEVRGDDRERLENLCRYLLRPPLADRRLRLLPGDHVALELKSPWKDGTTWVSMSADAFLESTARTSRAR
jgi:hypothetical protein